MAVLWKEASMIPDFGSQMAHGKILFSGAICCHASGWTKPHRGGSPSIEQKIEAESQLF